jgi:hypothetical protein
LNGSEFDFLGPEGRARLSMPLAGRHNVSNALAALAAASVWGMGAAEAREVFPKLEATGMRGRVLRYDAGFTVINDCYNSNPVALAAMVELLAQHARGRTSSFSPRAKCWSWVPLLPNCIAKRDARLLPTESSTGSSGCRVTRKVSFGGPWKPGNPRRGQNFSRRPRRPGRFLENLVERGDVLLVKGSRGVKMERIVEALDSRFARSQAEPAGSRVERRAPRSAPEMLLYFSYDVLQRYFHALNVFRYITVRTALASLTALLITLVLGPWVIRRLRELQIGQFIREEGPKSHQSKAGTPTMGGVLIVGSTVIPTLLWGDLENAYVWLAVFTMLAFGAIGFIDDYSKVVKKRNLGLTGKRKFFLQTWPACAVAVTLLSLTASGTYSTQLSVPFFKNFHPDLVIHSLLCGNTFGGWPIFHF